MIKYGIIHCHTEHSLRDSTLTVNRLVERAVELDAPAITLTDHGTLTGIDEFMEVCKKNNVKGIPGLEAYVAEDGDARLHLLLLPIDYTGYLAISDALVEANTRIKKAGVLIFPEMNKEILKRNFGKGSKGYGHVIATSACVGGILAGINYDNEKKKKEYEELLTVCKDAQIAEEAKRLNEEAITALKAELKDVDKLAKKTYKKETNALNKITDKAAYDKAVSELNAKKIASASAIEKAIKMRFEINAKSKKITELKKRIPQNLSVSLEKLKELKNRILTKEQLIQKMREEALIYQDIFGIENFYIEIQNHCIPEETEYMYILDNIAKELNIPTVAANDVHMAKKEDFEAREIITSSRFHKYEPLSEYDKELYIKTDEELFTAISAILGTERANIAMENVGEIIDRCNVVFPDEKHYPVFDKTQDSNALIRKLAYERIPKRYTKEEWTKQRADLLEYELNIICSMGYADYHLIVQDFINFGKKLGFMPIKRYEYLQQNIRNMSYSDIISYVEADQSEVGFTVGPGRGSAAGSILCYLFGITDIDPTKFGLIFERFLNPERISMPDIDTDFANGYREVVIEYIYKKYGKNAVCRIMTEGTYAARGSIREVAKILGTIPGRDPKEYEELGDRLAKVIPVKPNETISGHMEEYEIIQEKEDNRAMEIIQKALLIEGSFVQYGMHAAGVIISDNDKVSEYVPLMWDETNEQWKCQCDMVRAEEKHLLKMDFLGLKNLNIITDVLREIKRTTGRCIDVNRDILEEKEVITAICATGNTNSIFQLESSGFKSMLKEFKPDSMEDLILLLAAYRPGPMEFIPKMIAVKHGREPLTYLCPQLEPILKPTYGCIIYQEQVQEIFKTLAGYSLGQADLVRRAMSKKKEAVLLKERQSFIYGDVNRNIPGCVANGISEVVADKLFDDMVSFAKYAFNKSHAAAYARVTYITAWLKYHYPVQHMCIALEYSTTKKISGLIEECKKMDIEVLPIDVNKSKDSFYSENGKIYFGISSIKGINEVGNVILEREHGSFKSFSEFILRTSADKTVVEGLIKVGGFDSFCKNRAALLAVYSGMENLLKSIKDKKKKIAECEKILQILQQYEYDAQEFILEKINEVKKVKTIPSIEKTETALEKYRQELSDIVQIVKKTTIPIETLEDEVEKLEVEKKLLGVYVTGHPLNAYETPNSISPIQNAIASQKNRIYGIIHNLKVVQTRKTKEDMAFFDLEDKSGIISCVCFPKKYKEIGHLLKEDGVFVVGGKVVEEVVEKFGSSEAEENGITEIDNTVETEVVQKIFVDFVESVSRKRKELILEIPNIMDWADYIKTAISSYIVKDNGCVLILHDNLFNELRPTNLLVSPALLKTNLNCFIKTA